jgi:cell division septation protein DedD
MLTTLLLLLHSADPSPVQALQEDLRIHPWRYTSIAPATSNTTTVAATAPAATTTPGAGWSIQLASLSSEDAALKRKDEIEALLGKGMVTVQASAGTWKLRTGSFPDRKTAQKAKEEIKKKGLDGFVVEP